MTDRCQGRAGTAIARAGGAALVAAALAALWVAPVRAEMADVDPITTAAVRKQPKSSFTAGPPPLALAKIAAVPTAVIGHRHRVEPKAAFQTIVYGNGTRIGENSLTLEVGLADGNRYRPQAADSDAAREVRRLFPGVSMTIDRTVRLNALGQYGVATGSLGKRGGACLYAWQAVKPRDEVKTEADIDTNADPTLNLPLRITLRYCDPKARPQQLIDWMRGLTVHPITSRKLDLLR